MWTRAFARRVLLGSLASATVAAQVSAATLPSGFKETKVPGGTMTNVTAMAIVPDGRILVSEQGTGAPPAIGRVRLIKNDVLQTTPALELTVDATNERGVLGIAIDPDFATNQYIYIYYHQYTHVNNPCDEYADLNFSHYKHTNGHEHARPYKYADHQYTHFNGNIAAYRSLHPDRCSPA